MAQVTEIAVRYLRKIQVRDYEPAECEITLKAILLDGDDVVAVAPKLTEFISAQVHEALGLPASTKIPVGGKPVRARGTEAVKTGDGKGVPQTAVSVEVPDNAPAKAAGAASAGIPDTAPATKAAAVDASGIPDTPPPAAPAKTLPAATPPAPAPAAVVDGPAEMTPGGLSKWVGAKVREGKIDEALNAHSASEGL